MIKSPIDLLMPYQREVFDDPSRFIAWNAGRQSGKSFTGAGWANQRCAEAPNTTVLIGSPSERQSLEANEKCKMWAEANHLAIVDEIQERDYPGALMKSSTIIFPNKSRIVAVPGKPDTVRGFTAHVWLDEFGFFEDPARTWKAVIPAISNQLKGKKRVLLTSTPNGKSGAGKKLWEILTDKGKIEVEGLHSWKSGVWSCHQTTILDAAPFLGTDIDELRAGLDDEEAWEQEFMCKFIDGSKVLLTYAAMALCEDVSCSIDPAEVLVKNGQYFAGIDFGRTNDPTAMWILEKMPQGWYRTAGVLTFKGANTVDQIEALKPYIVRCQKVCVDYTGPGIGFGDMLAKDEDIGADKMGTAEAEIAKCELCTFSQNFKCEIFPKLKSGIDAKQILLPIDTDTREDLHEMQQIINNGKYNYAARRTAEGHSDRCTALALAWRATTFEGMACAEPPEEEVPEGYKYRRGWN